MWWRLLRTSTDLAQHYFMHVAGTQEAAPAPAAARWSSWEAVLRVTLHLGNLENVHCLVTANYNANLGSSVIHFVDENGEVVY